MEGPHLKEGEQLGLPRGPVVFQQGCRGRSQEHLWPQLPQQPHPHWDGGYASPLASCLAAPQHWGASQIHQGNPVQLEGWSPLGLGHPRPRSPSGLLMVRGRGRRVPEGPQHSDPSRGQVCQWLLALLLPQGTLLSGGPAALLAAVPAELEDDASGHQDNDDGDGNCDIELRVHAFPTAPKQEWPQGGRRFSKDEAISITPHGV